MARKKKVKAMPIEFFKYNPLTDGEKTFNINKALNENWDKINEKVQELEESVVGIDVTWDGISGKPETFPPSTHTHKKSNITDLPSDLVTQTMLNEIGLGENCKRVTDSENFNNITQQGNFMAYKPKNVPSTHIWLGDWWYLRVRRHNDDYIEQEVTSVNPNTESPYRGGVFTWKRIKNGGVWRDWSPCNNPTITLYVGYKADFNLLTLHGTVLIPTDEVANECLNKPTGHAGVLEVMPIVSNPNGSGVLQRFTPYNNCTKPLVRRYYDYGAGEWTPWKPQDSNNADSLGGKLAREYQVYLGDDVSLEVLKDPSYTINYDCWVSLDRATGIGLPHGGNWHLSFKKHKNTDGYGTQMAIPYGRNEIYMRSAEGKAWNLWSKVGGGMIKRIQRGTVSGEGETVTVSNFDIEKSILIVQHTKGGGSSYSSWAGGQILSSNSISVGAGRTNAYWQLIEFN